MAKQNRLLIRTPHSALRNRKGVLLLVILGMLTLFLMIGTAFIMSGNQYRRANKTYSKVGEQKNLQASQDGFLSEVINQIVRDTSNQNSSLRFHSLLRDLYGTEGLVATIPTAAPVPTWAGDIISGTTNNVTANQMLEFQIPVANFRDYFGNVLATGRVSQVENFHKGQILTFLDGVAKGRSTRVVGYFRRQIGAQPLPTDPAIIRVLNVTLENGQPIADPTVLAGSRILINGRPFNGTGVGYNPDPTLAANAPKLGAKERVILSSGTPELEIALMPNAPFFMPANLAVTGTSNYFSPQWTTLTTVQQQTLLNSLGYDGLGGSDESYDAPDFQNMFLAWTAPGPAETNLRSLTGTDPPTLGGIVLPSYHRPELIHYWAKQAPFWTTGSASTSTLAEPQNASLLRKVLLRPNWNDHPEFTGSNPEFAEALAVSPGAALLRMIYGPWDVDNDMDGIRDSQWIDFGAPVMVGSKGRLVKPLAAIMVLDMDGRLNVNAHSTPELAGTVKRPNDFTPPNTVTLAGNVLSSVVPRGQAYGPAEISLGPALGDRHDNLIEGGTFFGKYWPGRYGVDEDPGIPQRYDLAAQLKMQGYPGTDPRVRSNFGTYPDLRGRYATGLNDFGQWITDWSVNDYNDANGNNAYDAGEEVMADEGTPYELDLSSTGARGEGTSADNPFSVAEFERLLRAYDLDAGTLSPRLFELLKGSDSIMDAGRLREYRTLLTTDSYDLPEPSFQVPAWVRTGIPGLASSDFSTVMGRQPVNATYADLIEYRFRVSQTPIWNVAQDAANPTRIDDLKKQIRRVIAPEMLAGLKFDLNRPFGNGKDDNGNGIVDEPGEYFDANGNGQFDQGEGDIYWQVDNNRLSGNEQGNTAKDTFLNSNYGKFRDDHDLNGNGVIDTDEHEHNNPATLDDLITLHNYRRQLYARQLYIMAMAMIDPLPPPTTDPSTPLTKAQIKESKTILADRARRLAQWAINVVDYRDPDNIMTGFEYDANPFNGWQVDEDLRTTTDLPNFSDNGVTDTTPMNYSEVDRADVEELAYRNGIDDDGDGKIDDDDPDEIAERQVVWGLERPEVLMTETLAWHDRATEDRGPGFEDAATDENLDGKPDEKDEGQVGDGTASGDSDTDYDQRARPQGATFIEFYNPYPANPNASADTHAVQGYNGVNFPGVDPGTDLGVNLSAVDKVLGTSPVWRLDIRRTVEYKTEGGVPRLALYEGGPDHDPDDPDVRVQPQIPDRTVYFTNFDPQVANANWDPFDGTSFFCSRAVPNDPTTHSIVKPGGYLVAGSGVPVQADGSAVVDPIATPNLIDRYEAWIGELSSKKPNQATLPNQARRAVVLDPKPNAQVSVMLRNDQPGVMTSAAVTDQGNFQVYSTPNTTSVAVIDRSARGYHRFSVSEPATGYPDATFRSTWKGKYYSDPSGYYSPTLDIPLDNQRWGKTIYGAGNMVDGQRIFDQINDVRWYRAPSSSIPVSPSNKVVLTKDNDLRLTLPEREERSVRTIPAFSWIYLQRLANPLLPWNPMPGHQKHRVNEIVNPYLTVDSMGVNVTVFNGQAREEKRRQETGVLEYNNDAAFHTFASLQRGRSNDEAVEKLLGRLRTTQGEVPEPSNNDGRPRGVKVTGYRNLRVTRTGNPGILEPAVDSQKNVNLWGEEHTGQAIASANPRKIVGMWYNRGGVNGNGNLAPGGSHMFNSIPDTTLGFMNEPFRRPNPTTDDERKFIPAQPFSWMTWNNRPFANAGEMLNVPAFRSSQILKVFSVIKNTAPTDPTTDTKGENSEQYSKFVRGGFYPPVLLDDSSPDRFDFRISFPEIVVDGPYAHLPNMFRTETTTENRFRGIVGLHRVFDLITVPSLYVGDETWLNPQQFGLELPVSTNTSDPRYGLQPPFNKIASRREPGRVNINTFSNKSVWDGIFHGSAKPAGGDSNTHAGPDDDELWPVRRGYEGIDPATGAAYTDQSIRFHPLLLDRHMPSVFSNPFRSNSAGDFVPLAQMRRPGGIGAGLLRSLYLPKVTGVGGGLNTAAQGATPTELMPTGVPFAATTAFADTNNTPATIENPQNMFRDSARNTYFRYSPISRLSSLTTNRSNVFAIWVTIGFFEVEEFDESNPTHKTILERFGTGTGTLADASADPLFQRVYPDGYMFTKEAGIETGEVERVREFAIVDRTIPVAFEPGANHNIGEMIRLRRKIKTE